MTEHTNPHQRLDDELQVGRLAEAGGTTPTAGVALLAISVVLLVMAVIMSALQKNWESRAGVGVAAQVPNAHVAAAIHKAEVFQVIGVSTALLAIATWGWGLYRRQSNRILHMSVLTLLTLFVLMQLLMV